MSIRSTSSRSPSPRADEVADSVASRYNLPNCGQGVEPTNCQCRSLPCFGSPIYGVSRTIVAPSLYI